MGVNHNQHPVQLTVAVLGLLTKVGTDDIVQHHLLGVVPVVADQSQAARRWQYRRVLNSDQPPVACPYRASTEPWIATSSPNTPNSR